MAAGAIATGAYGIGKTLGVNFGGVTDFLGIGNNRGSKRDKRNSIRDSLYNAGVSRRLFKGVHSDQWRELEQIAKFLQREGQPGLTYINKNGTRNLGSKEGGPSASELLRGFKQSNYVQRTTGVAPPMMTAGTFSNFTQNNEIPILIAVVGIILSLIYYFKQ